MVRHGCGVAIYDQAEHEVVNMVGVADAWGRQHERGSLSC
jgi:hypothetical protein